MTKLRLDTLSRRQRQIMDILFELKSASVEDVRSRLPDPPTYSAARAMIGKLESKGFVRHYEKGLRYVYEAAVPRGEARRSAVQRLAKVFYGGSMAQAAAGLLEQSVDAITEEELDHLSELIERARRDSSGGRS